MLEEQLLQNLLRLISPCLSAASPVFCSKLCKLVILVLFSTGLAKAYAMLDQTVMGAFWENNMYEESNDLKSETEVWLKSVQIFHPEQWDRKHPFVIS